MLATMVREDKNIKGISIDRTEHKNKISQYADDAEIILEGDRNLFEETVKIIDIFGKNQVSSWMRGKLMPYSKVVDEIRLLDICHI